MNSTLDPFRITGPACVSFSGGRTSAYMLRRILDAHGGGLPEDVHVVFANTGKERIETLDFVHECAARWDVAVRWIEYFNEPNGAKLRHSMREVTYKSASRSGEPFEMLIAARSFLPNPVMRMCTQELKIRPMIKFAVQELGLDHWLSIVGLRADEPRRVAKTKEPSKERYEIDTPLSTAGVTVADVMAYWASSPFDLQLKSHEGNCDLCFLKGRDRLDKVIRARPDLAAWWIAQEERGLGKAGDGTFRKDRPSYRRMLTIVQATPMLPGLDIGEEDVALPCACTD